MLLLDEVRVDRRPPREALAGPTVIPAWELLLTHARRVIATFGRRSFEITSPRVRAFLFGEEAVLADQFVEDEVAIAELYSLYLVGAVACHG